MKGFWENWVKPNGQVLLIALAAVLEGLACMAYAAEQAWGNGFLAGACLAAMAGDVALRHDIEAEAKLKVLQDAYKDEVRDLRDETRERLGKRGRVSERTCRNVSEPPESGGFWPSPHFKCSECGCEHVSTDYVYYCPNCGAKVEGEPRR